MTVRICAKNLLMMLLLMMLMCARFQRLLEE